MKRTLTAVLCAVCVLCSSCVSLTPSQYGELAHGGSISVMAQYPVYAQDIGVIQLLITNGSEEDLSFDSSWELEYRRDGEWRKIPFLDDIAWDDLLYLLPAGNSRVFDADLRLLNFDFPDGNYRFLKKLNYTVYAAEFSIGKSAVSAASPYGYIPLENLPKKYSAKDAEKDGVLFEDSDPEQCSTVLNTFFAQLSSGMNTQIRLGETEDKKLTLIDIIAQKHMGSWRFLIRWDETRAGGELTQEYYSHMVTDGKRFALSNQPVWESDSRTQVLLKLLRKIEWLGQENAIRLLQEMNEEEGMCLPLFWSPDGMAAILLSETPLEFSVSRQSANGGGRGYMDDIADVPGMEAIREVVWEADGDTVVFVCSSEEEAMTGYVYYSMEDEAVLRYTLSAHDYEIGEDGEIEIGD